MQDHALLTLHVPLSLPHGRVLGRQSVPMQTKQETCVLHLLYGFASSQQMMSPRHYWHLSGQYTLTQCKCVGPLTLNGAAASDCCTKHNIPSTHNPEYAYLALHIVETVRPTEDTHSCLQAMYVSLQAIQMSGRR